jgi:hypothetical protein
MAMVATRTRLRHVVLTKIEREMEIGHLSERQDLEEVTKRRKYEPTAHRDGLPTVRVTTATMATCRGGIGTSGCLRNLEQGRVGPKEAQGGGDAAVKTILRKSKRAR